MEQRKPRVAAFDRIRAIAILGVILGSISELLVATPLYNTQPLSFTWHLANFFASLCRPAIPLLLMAFGGIMLQKQEVASASLVLKRRAAPLLLSLAIWSAFYFLFRFLYQGPLGEDFFPAGVLANVFNTPVSSHLWLIYLLLALYLLLPLMRLLTVHGSRRLVRYVVALWLIYSCLWPALSGLIPELSLPNYASLQTMAGYAGYPLLGWLLATGEWRPSPRLMLIGAAVCAVLTTVGAALMTKSAGEPNLVFYQHFMLNIVAGSVCLFMAGRGFEGHTVFSPWLVPMAQFVPGMYFLYSLFEQLLIPVMRVIPGILTLLFAPALILIVTLVTVAFIRRSHVLRRILFGEVSL